MSIMANEEYVFTATDAKNRFGELLDAAQHHPITITKHGRPVAVLIGFELYKKLKRMG